MKKKLLNSFEELIFDKEQEYEKIRVEDITKGAGVAKGSFYTYFKTKDDILAELLLGRIAEIQDRAKENLIIGKNLKERLDKFLKVLFEEILGHKETLSLLGLVHKVIMSGPKNKVFKKCKPMRNENVVFLMELSQDEIDEEIFEKREEVASGLEGFMARYFLQKSINGDLNVKDKDWLESERKFIIRFIHRSIKKEENR